MYYAVTAQDNPNAGDQRLVLRDRHFAYLKSLGEKLVFAGALFDARDNMDGSLMVLDAESLDEAEALVAGDPFVSEGLYIFTQVKRWSFSFNNLATGSH
ncbi:YciI family protein [Oceanicella sp. SM1341]|uniref:YciI family protein n=1 Tax=Oceanicella sp. SM1341 TaxID=1548889 RepID=UPI000E52897B|nr:YciI family protein [Oceanicella sp. SM1341]